MADLLEQKKPDWREEGVAVFTAADGLTSFHLQDVAAEVGDVVADIVLRGPVTLQAADGHPPIWTDDKDKHIRLVIDARGGDIETGCVVAEGPDATGLPTPLEAVKAALDIGGVDELVILGRGPGRDIHSEPSVTRLAFEDRIEIDGNTLLRYMERDDPIAVFTRQPKHHVVVWPKEC